MLKMPMEEANSSKYPSMSPKASLMIGTIEKQKDIRRLTTEKELVRIVEQWATAKDNVLSVPERLELASQVLR